MKFYKWIFLIAFFSIIIGISFLYHVDHGDDTRVRFLNQETDPAVVNIQRHWANNFSQEHPSVYLVIESAPNTVINQRIASYVQAGASLDVIHGDGGSTARMAMEGLLAPLDDVVDNLGGRDAFLPGRLLIINDQVYAINQAATTPVLHYRKDVFENAGLEPPDTWEELLHAARTLHSSEMAGIAIPGGENRATTIYSGLFLWQNGGDFFNADLDVTLDNGKTYEALQFYSDLLQYAPNDAAAWGFTEPIESFWSGRSAMLLYWHGLDLTFRQNPAMVDNIGIAPVPKGKMRVTEEGGRYVGVFANSDVLSESKNWVEFIFRAENATLLTEIQPMLYPPTTYEAMELLRESSAPTIQAYGDALFDVVYQTTNHSYNAILNAGGINDLEGTIEHTGIINPLISVLWNSNLYARAVQRVAYEGMAPELAAAEAHRTLTNQVEVARRELGY